MQSMTDTPKPHNPINLDRVLAVPQEREKRLFAHLANGQLDDRARLYREFSGGLDVLLATHRCRWRGRPDPVRFRLAAFLWAGYDRSSDIEALVDLLAGRVEHLWEANAKVLQMPAPAYETLRGYAMVWIRDVQDLMHPRYSVSRGRYVESRRICKACRRAGAILKDGEYVVCPTCHGLGVFPAGVRRRAEWFGSKVTTWRTHHQRPYQQAEMFIEAEAVTAMRQVHDGMR